MSRTCPKCFRADAVTQQKSIDGLWTFTCDDRRDHVDGASFVWDATNDPTGSDGDVRRSLGAYLAPLRACLTPDEAYVEYGIVEWRFRSLAPHLFAELMAEHGHTRLNPISSKKSTSAYLAQGLGLLAADGELVRVYGTATGTWSYNGRVTYWAAPPAPPTTSRLSWKQFALDSGLDPDDITIGPAGG
jgi:hypothetical protein